MKVKNYYVYGNEDYLKRLEEEYSLLGRNVRREDDRLIVFSFARKKRKKTPTQHSRKR